MFKLWVDKSVEPPAGYIWARTVNEDAIVRTKAYKLSDSEYVIELYTTDGQMAYLVYPSKEEQGEVLDYIWSEEED